MHHRHTWELHFTFSTGAEPGWKENEYTWNYVIAPQVKNCIPHCTVGI